MGCESCSTYQKDIKEVNNALARSNVPPGSLNWDTERQALLARADADLTKDCPGPTVTLRKMDGVLGALGFKKMALICNSPSLESQTTDEGYEISQAV